MGVWDCFCINDELDLLEFRLTYLDAVVDHYVIVEAAATFRSQPKPLHVSENLTRFAQWSHKMALVVVDDMPLGQAPFSLEGHQHGAIRRALSEVTAEDVVIVGDPDEIPYRDLVARLPSTLGAPARLIVQHAVNYANHRLSRRWEDGPKACRGADLDHPEMAVLLGHPDARWEPGGATLIENAGWHLSYLGGPAEIARKFGAFSHSEFDVPMFRDANHLTRCLAAGIDFQGERKLEIIPRASLDELQAALFTMYPHLFSFEIQPAGWRRESLLAYTHLRAQQRLPAGVVAQIDGLPVSRLTFLTLPCVPVDLALRWMRRMGVRARVRRLLRLLQR